MTPAVFEAAADAPQTEGLTTARETFYHTGIIGVMDINTPALLSMLRL
jgi:hypothetical protein